MVTGALACGSMTSQLSTIALKRLTGERRSFEQEDLKSCGIYHWFDEDHLDRAWAMIVGPSGTPYANGFYFFEFTFPADYPWAPPRAVFLTGDGRVRFNPNLYVEGKVCLSILGTWPGESWSSALTFRSVLLSIQSLFSSSPLQNEPGYEMASGQHVDLYSKIIAYENIAVSVMQAVRLPKYAEPFQEDLTRMFLSNAGAYARSLAQLAHLDGQCVTCPVYGFVTRFAPLSLQRSLEAAHRHLLSTPATASGAAWPLTLPSRTARPAGYPGPLAVPKPSPSLPWRAATSIGPLAASAAVHAQSSALPKPAMPGAWVAAPMPQPSALRCLPGSVVPAAGHPSQRVISCDTAYATPFFQRTTVVVNTHLA